MKRTVLLVSFILSFSALGKSLFLSPHEVERRNAAFEVLSQKAQKVARGSDIIGNGGGVAEQRILYLLRHLDRYLAMALNQNSVFNAPEDRDVIERLIELVIEKRSEKNSLMFLKKSDFRGFFNNVLDSGERLAKTGFSSDFPIFVNVTSLYEDNLKNNSSFLLGLLVHELGHQLGIASHQYLDELAVKVRSVFEDFYSQVLVQFGQKELLLSHYGEEGQFSFDRGVLSIGRSHFPFSIGPDDYECRGASKLIGVNWSNLHFNPPQYNGGELSVSVGAWVKLFCMRMDSGSLYIEEKQGTFDFQVLKSPLGKESYELRSFDVSFSRL